jgi:hypothetical protein
MAAAVGVGAGRLLPEAPTLRTVATRFRSRPVAGALSVLRFLTTRNGMSRPATARPSYGDPILTIVLPRTVIRPPQVKGPWVSVVDRGEPVASCWEWHGDGTAGEHDVGSRPGGGASSGDGRGPSRATQASLASAGRARGRPIGLLLFHRHREAIAAQLGPIGADRPEYRVEADAGQEWRATVHLEMGCPRSTWRGREVAQR